MAIIACGIESAEGGGGYHGCGGDAYFGAVLKPEIVGECGDDTSQIGAAETGFDAVDGVHGGEELASTAGGEVALEMAGDLEDHVSPIVFDEGDGIVVGGRKIGEAEVS